MERKAALCHKWCGENHEDDEVNFVLPPKFDEHEEQEDDDDKGACKAFISFGNLQSSNWCEWRLPKDSNDTWFKKNVLKINKNLGKFFSNKGSMMDFS